MCAAARTLPTPELLELLLRGRSSTIAWRGFAAARQEGPSARIGGPLWLRVAMEDLPNLLSRRVVVTRSVYCRFRAYPA